MGNRILVVDDAKLNRELLADILEDDYEIEMAEDGVEAVSKIKEGHRDFVAILLDLQMPRMDGFAVLTEMIKNGWMDKIPVLIISGEQGIDVENRCFEMGVSDFIHKPFEPTLVQNRVKNTVDLFTYKNQLEAKVEEQTETLRKQNEILQMQAEQLKENYDQIIEILGTVVEYRNLESGQHVKRVKGFTEILAYQMMEDYPEYGLDEHKIEMIVTASSLHDVGKICIPDKILLKPGRFTDEEYEYMKSHTTRGCDLLCQIDGVWNDEYRQTIYEICRYHHERHNGSGYPDGLMGDEIPISAQIVSIADVYDALVCERVYKAAYPLDKAFHMILNGECGSFSPKLLECFKKVRDPFEKLVADTNNASSF